MITLNKFPLPPSVNTCFKPRKRDGRLVKTPEYLFYANKVILWKLKNFKTLEEFKNKYEKYQGAFRVDLCFVFHKPRIIRKDGFPKNGQNDSNNFIKPVYDSLSKLIDIDDARFNSQFIERVYCENESEQQVIIQISESKIRSIQDFKSCNNQESTA